MSELAQGIVSNGNSQNTTENTLGGGIYLETGELILKDNLRLESNNALTGGGIYVENGTLKLNNLGSGANAGILNNTASEGAGIYILRGDVQIKSSNVSNNIASLSGGGIFILNGSLNITGISDKPSTISGNTASLGGGIYVGSQASLTISQSEVSHNIALSETESSGFGGGIYVVGGNITLRGASIISNEANFGGGLYIPNMETNLEFVMYENTTISSNKASYGGGLYVDRALTLTQGLISQNVAEFGGQIYVGKNALLILDRIEVTTGVEVEDNYTSGIYLEEGTVKRALTVSNLTNIHRNDTFVYLSQGSIVYVADRESSNYQIKLYIAETENTPLTEGNQIKVAEFDRITYASAGRFYAPLIAFTQIDKSIYAVEATVIAIQDEYNPEEQNYATLKEAVELSNNNSTLKLIKNQEITSETAVTIEKGKTATIITDNGSIITRGENSENEVFNGYLIGVFGTLNLNNSTSLASLVVDGKDIDSASSLIYVGSSGVLNIYDNVEIRNNNANVNTINIYNPNTNDTIYVQDAYNGGGIYIAGGIVAMYGGTIHSNTARNGGAVYLLSGSFAMSNGSIGLEGGREGSQNVATSYGGGIFVESGSLTLNSALITNNSAANGGGVYAHLQGMVNINNSEISNNTANGDGESSGLGGGVYLSSSNSASKYYIANSSFTNNTASSGGGLYINAGSVVIGENNGNTNDTFTENSADNGGAIYVCNEGSIELNYVTMTGNTAYNNGGAVYYSNNSNRNQSRIYNSHIGTLSQGNLATNSGGGIYVDSGTLRLEGDEDETEFTNFVTNNSATRGGGIYVGNSGKLEARYTSINQNTNGITAGAGIYVNTSREVDLVGCLVEGNKADNYGGGIYLENGNLSVVSIVGGQEDGLLRNESASGAGIYIDGGYALLENAIISENTSVNYGGGLFIASGNADLVTSVITDNIISSSAKDGQGIYYAGGNLTLFGENNISNPTLDDGMGSIVITGETTLDESFKISGSISYIYDAFYLVEKGSWINTYENDREALSNMAFTRGQNENATITIIVNTNKIEGDKVAKFSASTIVRDNLIDIFELDINSHRMLRQGEGNDADYIVLERQFFQLVVPDGGSRTQGKIVAVYVTLADAINDFDNYRYLIDERGFLLFANFDVSENYRINSTINSNKEYDLSDASKYNKITITPILPDVVFAREGDLSNFAMFNAFSYDEIYFGFNSEFSDYYRQFSVNEETSRLVFEGSSDSDSSIITNYGKMTLGKGIVVRNENTSSDTGVINNFGELIIDGAEIYGNTSIMGGAVYVSDGETFINSGEIYNNSATYGGAIYLSNSAKLTINGGNIGRNNTGSSDDYRNKALYGGGIYVDGGEVIINGGNISYNYAETSGGGIFITSGIDKDGNSTRGKVTINSSPVSGEQTNVSYNEAGEYGGGIFVEDNYLVATNFSEREKNLVINGGNINNNTAKTGGGIYGTNFILEGDTKLYSGASTFGSGSNETKVYGVAVSIQGGSISQNSVTLDSALVDYGFGANIYMFGGEVEMSQGSILGNGNSYLVAKSGGGLYLKDSKFTMTGGSISNNAVSTSGGGVYVDKLSTFIMNGAMVNNEYVLTTISSNYAILYGGGIFQEKGTRQIDVGNEGESQEVTVSGNVTLVSGSISGNTVGSSGFGPGAYVDSEAQEFTLGLSAKTVLSDNLYINDAMYLANGSIIFVNAKYNPNYSTEDRVFFVTSDYMADDYEINGERVVIARYSNEIPKEDTISIEAKLFKGYDSNSDQYCFIIYNSYDVVIGRMNVAKLVVDGGSLSFFETLESALNSVYDSKETYIYILVTEADETTGNKLTISNNAIIQGNTNITVLSGNVNEAKTEVYENELSNPLNIYIGSILGNVISISEDSEGNAPNITFRNVKFIGSGANAQSSIRLFSVSGGNVVFSNAIITDINSSISEGSVLYADKGNITIEGTLVSRDGAVVGTDPDGSPTGGVRGMQVINNTSNTGVIYVTKEAHLTLDGIGVLIGNNTTKNGAVAVDGASLVVKNGVEFSGNSSSNGGALYVRDEKANLEIGSSSFVNNTAKSLGGAIFFEENAFSDTNGKLIFTGDVLISGNSALDKGGGIYNGTNIEIKLSSVSRSGEDFRIQITGNEASYGGGIYSIGNLMLQTGVDISSNSANYGGGVYINGGDLIIDDLAQISSNLVLNAGGGIYASNSVVNIASSQITENGMTIDAVGGYGGGVFVESGTLEVQNEANITSNSSVIGAGIYAGDSVTLKVLGGLISSNEASSNGGGIYFKGNNLEVLGGSISSNIAHVDGGGIYAEGSGVVTLDVSNGEAGEISGNSADANGGGICVNGPLITLAYGDVHSNTSANGAGIYIYDATIKSEITSGLSSGGQFNIYGNIASNNGGALYIEKGFFNIAGGNIGDSRSQNVALDGANVYVAGGKLTITGGNIRYGNASQNGGGLYVDMTGENQAVVLFSNGEISNNISQSGAGIFIFGNDSTVSDNGKVIISDTARIRLNTAQANGGGIYSSGILEIEVGVVIGGDSESEVNSASLGGGIYVANGYVNIDGATIQYNEAIAQSQYSGNGGGMYIMSVINSENSPSMRSQVINTTFNENSARNGGGLYYAGGIFDFSSNTFTRNRAADKGFNGGYGGGLYLESTSDKVFTLSSLKVGLREAGNQAVNGGGIYVNSGNYKLEGNADQFNINYNNASASGGGIYVNSSFANVQLIGQLPQDSNNNYIYYFNISENTAGENGGGLYNSLGVVNMNYVSVDSNEAGGYGGGIYSISSGNSLEGIPGINVGGGSIISQNTAQYGGGVSTGAGQDNYGNIVEGNSVISGLISENSARNGGGIYVNSSADGNSTLTLAEAGSSSTFNGVTGVYSNIADRGAGVYVEGGNVESKVNINGNVTKGIETRKDSDTGEIRFNKRRLDLNSGENYDGGGVFIEGGTFTQRSGSIENNHARNRGGGIFIEGGTLELKGQVLRNTALNGGGVYANNGTLNISGNINKNEAVQMTNTDGDLVGGLGGGIYVAGGPSFKVTLNNLGTIGELENVKYTPDVFKTSRLGDGSLGIGNLANTSYGNKAVNGGGIYIQGGSSENSYDIGGNIIANNARNGGGIYVAGNSRVTISANTSIAKNIALPIGGSSELGKGGGIYVAGGYLTVSSSATIGSSLDTKDYERIKGLSADVSEDASSYELFGSNIANLGGGIYLTNQKSTEAVPATVDFKGYIGYNIALKLVINGIDCGAGNGGGIYSERSDSNERTMRVIGSTSNNLHEYPSAVSHNIAEGMGGGLYLNYTELSLNGTATISLNNAKTSLTFNELGDRYISGEAGGADFNVSPYVNEVYLNYGSINMVEGGILGEDQTRVADNYYSLSLYWFTTGSFNFTDCIVNSAGGGLINGDVFIKTNGELSVDSNMIIVTDDSSSSYMQGKIRLTYFNGLPGEFFTYYNQHHGRNLAFIKWFKIFDAPIAPIDFDMIIVNDDIVRFTNNENKIVAHDWKWSGGWGKEDSYTNWDVFVGSTVSYIPNGENAIDDSKWQDIVGMVAGILSSPDLELLEQMLKDCSENAENAFDTVTDAFSKLMTLEHTTASIIKLMLCISTGEIRAFLAYVFDIMDWIVPSIGFLGDFVEFLIKDLLDFNLQVGGVTSTVNKWKDYRDTTPLGYVDITMTVVTVARIFPDALGFIPVAGPYIKAALNSFINGFIWNFDS